MTVPTPEKRIAAARRLAKEVDENGIPEDLEDGELAHMLTTLADLCERQQEAVRFLEMLSPYLDERQQPGEMWAALGCRQILEKFK